MPPQAPGGYMSQEPVSGGPQYGGHMPTSGPPAPQYGGQMPTSGPPAPQYGGQMPTSGPPAPPMGGHARLVSSDGRQYTVAIGSTTIGRGEQATMRLPDVGISRRHARIDYDGSQVVLTDLGSTNGTLVNGQRISAVALNPGDVIQVGTTTMTFRVDG
jgi:hypothetical protein